MGGKPNIQIPKQRNTALCDHFAIIAPVYDRLIPPSSRRRLIDLLDQPAGGRLLDAGGGTGRVACWLAGAGTTTVVGDVSRAMLARARAKNGLCPVRMAAERLPFADDLFDRIVVVDAFHHFQDQARALAELVRVLKPRGRLVIEEPDPTRWVGRFIAWAERLLRMDSHFYPAPRIKAMAETCGASADVVYDRMMFWVVVRKTSPVQRQGNGP